MINYTFVNCSSNQLLMFSVAKNGTDFLTEIHLLPYLFFPCISFLPLSLLQCDKQHSKVLCTLTVPLLQNRVLKEKAVSVHLLCINALSLKAAQQTC